MFLDVVELRDFYDGQLGLLARRMIRRRVRELWPDLRGQSLLGIGYTVPYLRPFRGEAGRVIAAMPAPQGVLHWPPEGPNASVLVDEAELPLEDASVDRVLLVHARENPEQRVALMGEACAVLAGKRRRGAGGPIPAGLRGAVGP